MKVQLLPMHVYMPCGPETQLRSCLMVHANFITNSALPKRPPSSRLEVCTPKECLEGKQRLA